MISGWTTVLNQGIHGDTPPNLYDVITERIKLDEFGKTLNWEVSLYKKGRQRFNCGSFVTSLG